MAADDASTSRTALRAVYEAGDEDGRMASARNEVEWVRTCELLRHWLPPSPARVLDVGGASGRYAEWLAQEGYDVLVFDLVPGHVRAARDRGLRAQLGDARRLPARDGCVDAVVLLGPLYHLPSPSERRRALAEARRVLRPGGVLVAAAMSRWAKPATLAAKGRTIDSEAARHLTAVMRRGQDAQGDAWDRITYNHDPAELRAEVRAAGFDRVDVRGVEGPLGAWARHDSALLAPALACARLAETDAAGASIHLLAAGWKPQDPSPATT